MEIVGNDDIAWIPFQENHPAPIEFSLAGGQVARFIDVVRSGEENFRDRRVVAMKIIELHQIVLGYTIALLKEVRDHGPHPGPPGLGVGDKDDAGLADFVDVLAASDVACQGYHSKNILYGG